MGSKEQLEKLKKNISSVIRGKDEVIELLLVALLGNGHVLVEDVPGVGKTTLAKALSRSISTECNRIQFTPDLLPADITGGMIYSPQTGEFSFRAGPLFCNILLADEVNRASPRTQSALLEAMSEQQVTVDAQTRKLESTFMVIATQNPVEYQGTYPLPEAQMDRFMMQIGIGYPSADEEVAIAVDQRTSHPVDDVKPILSLDDVASIQREVCEVAVADDVTRYIVEIVRATRDDPRVERGASTRGVLALSRAARALALLQGKSFVTPDHVKTLAPCTLIHRFSLDLKAKHGGETKEQVLSEIFSSVKVPV